MRSGPFAQPSLASAEFWLHAVELNAHKRWPVVTGELNEVAVAPDGTVFVVGTGGLILRGTDGGESWAPANTANATSTLRSLWIQGEQGWAVGDSGVILHTDDGGKNWKSVIVNYPDERLSDIAFMAGGKRGFIVGDGGILATMDGGNSWSPLTTAPLIKGPWRGIATAPSMEWQTTN